MRFPRPTLGATADVVGLVLAALAAISFVVGRLGWLLGLSAAVVAAGALALVLSWRRRHAVLTAVAVLVIGLGAGGVGAAAASASTVDAVVPVLRFDPQPDPVPYCRSYTGTGEVPGGYQLLIFDRGSDSGDPYYFHGQAETTERGWVVRTIGIGLEPTAAEPGLDAGARIDIFAQLVTEETARVLRDRTNIVIFPAGPDDQWLLRELPGRTVDTLRVVRAAGRGTCA